MGRVFSFSFPVDDDLIKKVLFKFLKSAAVISVMQLEADSIRWIWILKAGVIFNENNLCGRTPDAITTRQLRSRPTGNFYSLALAILLSYRQTFHKNTISLIRNQFNHVKQRTNLLSASPLLHYIFFLILPSFL